MMKLILAVTMLCKVVFAQNTSFLQQVEVSTPTPTEFILNNTSRKICNEDDRCAIVEYDSEDERNRYCECPEGSDCVFERDMVDDCAGDESCMNYVDSALKSNRSLNRYVCRKRISVENYSEYFVQQMQHIISEMHHLQYEREYISTLSEKLVIGRYYGVPVATIKNETDYLDNILPYFNKDVVYLEKVAAGMENFKVPPEGTFAYREINTLKTTIQLIVSRTEELISFYSKFLGK